MAIPSINCGQCGRHYTLNGVGCPWCAADQTQREILKVQQQNAARNAQQPSDTRSYNSDATAGIVSAVIVGSVLYGFWLLLVYIWESFIHLIGL